MTYEWAVALIAIAYLAGRRSRKSEPETNAVHGLDQLGRAFAEHIAELDSKRAAEAAPRVGEAPK